MDHLRPRAERGRAARAAALPAPRELRRGAAARRRRASGPACGRPRARSPTSSNPQARCSRIDASLRSDDPREHRVEPVRPRAASSSSRSSRPTPTRPARARCDVDGVLDGRRVGGTVAERAQAREAEDRLAARAGAPATVVADGDERGVRAAVPVDPLELGLERSARRGRRSPTARRPRRCRSRASAAASSRSTRRVPHRAERTDLATWHTLDAASSRRRAARERPAGHRGLERAVPAGTRGAAGPQGPVSGPASRGRGTPDYARWPATRRSRPLSSVVEHLHGKEGVVSSILTEGSAA